MNEASKTQAIEKQGVRHYGSRFVRALARVGLCGVFGISAATLLASSQADVGPAEIEMSLELKPHGNGGTELDLAPLGTVDFPTHSGFVGGHVEVTQLDLDEVGNGWSSNNFGESIKSDISNIEDARKELYEKSAIYFAIAAGGVAVAGALLIDRERKSNHKGAFARWGSAGVASLLIPIGAGCVAASTTTEAGFDRANYSGALTEVPEITQGLGEIGQNIEDYDQQIADAIKFSGVLFERYKNIELLPNPANTVAILSVSDIGSELGSYELIKSIVESFNVDAVTDNGDLTEFGTPMEGVLFENIEKLDIPYISILGNHDNPDNLLGSLLENSNAINLNFSETKVDGITIYGVNDPRFTVGQNRSLIPDQNSVTKSDQQVMEKLGNDVVDAIEGRDDIDIVLMPDPKSARVLIGKTRTIIYGHTHTEDFSVDNGTQMINPGTFGGEGLRPIDGKNADTYRSGKILYIDKDTKEITHVLKLNLGEVGQFQLSTTLCTVVVDGLECDN